MTIPIKPAIICRFCQQGHLSVTREMVGYLEMDAECPVCNLRFMLVHPNQVSVFADGQYFVTVPIWWIE